MDTINDSFSFLCGRLSQNLSLMKKENLELYFLFALILTISLMHSLKIKDKENDLKNASVNTESLNSDKDLPTQSIITSVNYK